MSDPDRLSLLHDDKTFARDARGLYPSRFLWLRVLVCSSMAGDHRCREAVTARCKSRLTHLQRAINCSDDEFVRRG